jgi:hypothetical protein
VIFSIVSPAKRGKKSTGGKEGEKRKKEKEKKKALLSQSYLLPLSYSCMRPAAT